MVKWELALRELSGLQRSQLVQFNRPGLSMIRRLQGSPQGNRSQICAEANAKAKRQQQGKAQCLTNGLQSGRTMIYAIACRTASHLVWMLAACSVVSLVRFLLWCSEKLRSCPRMTILFSCTWPASYRADSCIKVTAIDTILYYTTSIH